MHDAGLEVLDPMIVADATRLRPLDVRPIVVVALVLITAILSLADSAAGQSVPPDSSADGVVSTVIPDSVLNASRPAQDGEIVGWWRLLATFLVGSFGSFAYLSSIVFGFVGGDFRQREIMLSTFAGAGRSGGLSLLRFAWYSLIGGAVATVFQLPERSFVPIQSFVLGITWPSIVAQVLSGRQREPSTEEKQERLEQTLESRGYTPERLEAERRALEQLKTDVLQRFELGPPAANPEGPQGPTGG